MAYVCCLAGIDRAAIPMFDAVFRAAVMPAVATIARVPLAVTDLRRLAPDLLVCDIDEVEVEVDSLELLRRLRFVLPECLIAVYTGMLKRTWGMACHLAGANCVLSKDADEAELCAGVRDAMSSGCYTDPRFSAA